MSDPLAVEDSERSPSEAGATLMVQPATVVRSVTAYRPARHPAPVELDLSANEGAQPDPALFAAISPEVVRRYPRDSALREALAARLGLRPSQLIVTAGGDDALARAIRTVATPQREVILPMPTFEMLPRYTALAGATAIEVPWEQTEFPESEVLDRIGPRTAAIVLVSPNNPTGAVIAPETLRRIGKRAPHALIIVDLAYGEFADVDLTPVALELPNALVVRTLSKAWGLAGLRVGYAAGHEEVIGWLETVGQPFSVSGPALLIALRALEQDAVVTRFIEAVRGERAVIATALGRYGVRTSQSQANFVYAETLRADWIVDGLAGCGIRVRRFQRGGLPSAMRISCPGHPAGLEKLLAGIALTLGPPALLLSATAADMTGIGPIEQVLGCLPMALVGVSTGRSFGERFARVPGAANVSLALHILAVSRAWMACTSVAEIAQCKAAGVLPIALLPPGHSQRQSAPFLAAGAARVITSFKQLRELLG